jgi:hypothetical protein
MGIRCALGDMLLGIEAGRGEAAGLGRGVEERAGERKMGADWERNTDHRWTERAEARRASKVPRQR